MKNSWVSVKSEMPEDETNVLACNTEDKHDFFYIAYLWEGIWIDSMTDNTIDVTHWQYFSKPDPGGQ